MCLYYTINLKKNYSTGEQAQENLKVTKPRLKRINRKRKTKSRQIKQMVPTNI